jgi:type II secretory pathway pseudopilin PulG
MDFKTTSSDRRARTRAAAFTLVELLVSMGLASILAIAIASMSLYTGRSFAAIANYVDLDNKSRTALDTITRDVRQVGFLDSYSRANPAFIRLNENDDGGGLSTNTITFSYDATTRQVTRQRSGEPLKVLLIECDEFAFRFYQRNQTNNGLELVDVGTASSVKALDISWTCSRTILGSKMNTESVQTARIVMRKQGN